MRNRILAASFFAFIVSMTVVFTASDAFAISAYSRKYNTDCTMCHWNTPNKLNKFGQEYLRRGHRLPGESAKVNDVYHSLSDYMSISSKIRYRDTNRSVQSFDMEALSLYSGGPLSENFSYFYEQYLHESNTNGADREKLADAYLHYKTSPENAYVTLRAGQIAPYWMMTHGTGPRLSVSRPAVLADVNVGTNPYRPRQRQYGAEVGYVSETEGYDGYVGIVNGTGHNTPNLVDNNNYKDQYLTFQKTMDKNGSNLGLYAYNGRYPYAAYEENFWQTGIGGEYLNDKWSVFGMGLLGANENNRSQDYTNVGGFLEGDMLLVDKVTGFARYDYFDRHTDSNNDEMQSGSLGVNYWMTTFARLTAEGQLKEDNKATTNSFWLQAEFMY